MEVEGAMEREMERLMGGAMGQNVSGENVERYLMGRGTKEFFYG